MYGLQDAALWIAKLEQALLHRIQNFFPNLGHTSMLTTDLAAERRAECRPSPGVRKQLANNEVSG